MKPYYQDDSCTIYNGDCLELIKAIDNNSIDSIVTDPPYGISFMGKKWDYNIPTVEVWQECLRVLKPGGHVLIACGTRTQHRMAVNIEDAGFEIRDIVSWIYGCLSEDTEILTINGWERYHKDIDKNPVLCYNIDNETFEFNEPKRKIIYENKYTAYRIQSDNTDQIVSRNHRVVVERKGKFIFQRAEELQSEESIPFLESLPDLSKALSDYNQRAGNKEQRLQDLYKKENGKMEHRQETKENSMSNLQERILSNRAKQKEPKNILFTNMCRQGKRLVEKVFSKWERYKEPQEKSLGKEQSCLEGGSNLFQKAWKLFAYKICKMPEEIFTNGAQRWLCYGTSSYNGTKIGQTFIEDRSYTSYQSQSSRQQVNKFNALQDKQRTQIIRSTRATITPVEYNGKVWCIEVPTGAFVARRNGKIFITGNSGFPKSLNIGKAIDKMQGNERDIIGERRQRANSDESQIKMNASVSDVEIVTKGNSPHEGWGTALKPAMELWTLARKPLSEKTIAQNVLEWGTGGINIDGCRVYYNEPEKIANRHGRANASVLSDDTCGFDNTKNNVASASQLGRFPANLIHDGSDEVVGEFPDSKVSGAAQNGRVNINNIDYSNDNNIFGGGIGKQTGTLHNDSGSASRFFYCAKASKSERNMGCEGLDKKPMYKMDGSGNSLENFGSDKPRENNPKGLVPQPRQNFHPTVKPIALMKYLCRLITPPDGIVLDPYAGSGSTCIACKVEGFNYIGIEREPEYVEIAENRLSVNTFKQGQLL